jgi:hypothetical protein
MLQGIYKSEILYSSNMLPELRLKNNLMSKLHVTQAHDKRKHITCALAALLICICKFTFPSHNGRCVGMTEIRLCAGNNDDYDADGRAAQMQCTRRPGQMAWSAPLKYVLLRARAYSRIRSFAGVPLPYASSRAHVFQCAAAPTPPLS